MTRPEIEPRSPGPLVNTLPTRPMMRERESVNKKKDGIQKFSVEKSRPTI